MSLDVLLISEIAATMNIRNRSLDFHFIRATPIPKPLAKSHLFLRVEENEIRQTSEHGRFFENYQWRSSKWSRAKEGHLPQVSGNQPQDSDWNRVPATSPVCRFACLAIGNA
jgi:hypothetical protein